MAEALTNDILLDLQVVIDEVCTVGVVGHNPSDVCGCEDDGFGLLLIKELTYGDSICEIKFAVCASDKVRVASLLEVAPDG